MHSLGVVQWNSTRRDHPGNPGRVSGSGPVNILFCKLFMYVMTLLYLLRKFVNYCIYC